MKKEQFELLCKDGTRRSVDDYRTCNWGNVPSRAIVTSSATKFETRRLYQRFLEKAVRIFHKNRNDTSGYPINRFDSGQRDFENRPGYNKYGESGLNRGEGGYNRDEAGFNRGEGGFNRDEGGFNRGESGFNRSEGGFNRGEGSFNRDEGGFNRGEGGFNRGEGDFNRGEGGFNRGQGGFSRGEGSFNRGGAGFENPNEYTTDNWNRNGYERNYGGSGGNGLNSWEKPRYNDTFNYYNRDHPFTENPNIQPIEVFELYESAPRYGMQHNLIFSVSHTCFLTYSCC